MTRMMRSSGIRQMLVLMFALHGAAFAQERSANEVLSFLLTTQSVANTDFIRNQQASEATHDTLVSALLVELPSVPLTTSSGGFNYRFNPSLGTVERVTQGFGPFFVDRAATTGRGRMSFSATYRYAQFVTLDDRDLRDGSLITSSNKFGDESAPFDFETLKLDVQTSTVTFFGTYGLTDEIDVGVGIPVVHLRLSGERTNIYRGASIVQARGNANYIGMADIPIRVKLRFDRLSGWDLATNFELRVPTGSRDNLNGSGRYALTTAVIASTGEGPLESHANAAFTMGGASAQVIGGAAVAATLMNRVTVSAETLVRWIDQLRGIREVAEPHPSISGVDTIRLLPGSRSAATVAVVTGIRWNITSTWLVNSHVVVPITRGGLLARPIPAISLDYSFEP
jgi:hypothetical protein